MLGLNQNQLRHMILVAISGDKPALPKFRDLQQLADRIIVGVSYAIFKNNEEIERKLRDSGINIG